MCDSAQMLPNKNTMFFRKMFKNSFLPHICGVFKENFLFQGHITQFCDYTWPETQERGSVKMTFLDSGVCDCVGTKLCTYFVLEL